jgi:hypothetical protein
MSIENILESLDQKETGHFVFLQIRIERSEGV